MLIRYRQEGSLVTLTLYEVESSDLDLLLKILLKSNYDVYDQGISSIRVDGSQELVVYKMDNNRHSIHNVLNPYFDLEKLEPTKKLIPN